jgi:cell division protein FtsQ
MKRRMNHSRSRARHRPVNILHASVTPRRAPRKQMMQIFGWGLVIILMVAGTGVGLRFGLSFLLDQTLYQNPRYALAQIDIEPRGHFTPHVIRQAAGLELGQNLWTLDLPRIVHDLEQLPYVSSARVERQFPDRVTIHIQERVPVAKISGLNVDINTRETFYLDRDCIVLTPRADEPDPGLPEIIGLTNAELEPGVRLEQPNLTRALEILDAIDHTPLHTTIDIRTIDLSQPLSITMVTTRDMTINFRLDYVDQQLVRLKEALDYADSKQSTIHSIDLTPNQNVPVTFYQ